MSSPASAPKMMLFKAFALDRGLRDFKSFPISSSDGTATLSVLIISVHAASPEALVDAMALFPPPRRGGSETLVARPAKWGTQPVVMGAAAVLKSLGKWLKCLNVHCPVGFSQYPAGLTIKLTTAHFRREDDNRVNSRKTQEQLRLNRNISSSMWHSRVKLAQPHRSAAAAGHNNVLSRHG